MLTLYLIVKIYKKKIKKKHNNEHYKIFKKKCVAEKKNLTKNTDYMNNRKSASNSYCDYILFINPVARYTLLWHPP